jgi:hypothetical protein
MTIKPFAPPGLEPLNDRQPWMLYGFPAPAGGTGKWFGPSGDCGCCNNPPTATCAITQFPPEVVWTVSEDTTIAYIVKTCSGIETTISLSIDPVYTGTLSYEEGCTYELHAENANGEDVTTCRGSECICGPGGTFLQPSYFVAEFGGIAPPLPIDDLTTAYPVNSGCDSLASLTLATRVIAVPCNWRVQGTTDRVYVNTGCKLTVSGISRDLFFWYNFFWDVGYIRLDGGQPINLFTASLFTGYSLGGSEVPTGTYRPYRRLVYTLESGGYLSCASTYDITIEDTWFGLPFPNRGGYDFSQLTYNAYML